MSRRPVRFLSYALVAAVVWLALRNAPTIAQNPPAGDVEKRLKTLEDKLDKLTQLLTAREPRAAEGTTAKILTDTAERLRADQSAKEKQLADWRAKNETVHGPFFDGAMKRYSERLSKIETKRADAQLEAKMEEELSKIEKAYKEGGKPAAMDKIATSGLTARASTLVSKYEEEVLKLQLQKKKASATYAPNHPFMKEIDEAIELFRKKAGEEFKDGKDGQGGKDEDTPTKVMKALKERIDSLEMMIRTLDNMFEQDQRHVRDMAKAADEEKRLLADIDRARRAPVGVQAALLDLDRPAK